VQAFSVPDIMTESTINKELQTELEKQKDWTRGIVFTHDGKVLATTFDANMNEINDLPALWEDEDESFRSGIDIDGKNYDLHRFYDTLIYGRRGDSQTGEGVCVCKATKKKTKRKKERLSRRRRKKTASIF